jgi:hypothetical protein
MEADLRHRQMGFGALAPKLGIVSADVIELHRPQHSSNATVPELDTHAAGEKLHLGLKVAYDL